MDRLESEIERCQAELQRRFEKGSGPAEHPLGRYVATVVTQNLGDADQTLAQLTRRVDVVESRLEAIFLIQANRMRQLEPRLRSVQMLARAQLAVAAVTFLGVALKVL